MKFFSLHDRCLVSEIFMNIDLISTHKEAMLSLLQISGYALQMVDDLNM